MNELFDPQRMTAMSTYVESIADSQLLPEHLRGKKKNGELQEYSKEVKVANLMLVADAAQAFNAKNFFQFAKSSFVVGASLDFDGKLYAALANSSGLLAEELDYEYSGDGMDMSVIVTGRLKGESKHRTARLHVTTAMAAGGKNSTPEWKNNPEQQLAYAGARQWVRRHLSKVLFGLGEPISDEELAQVDADVQPRITVEVPSDDYRRFDAELCSLKYKHQVESFSQRILGRNGLTNDERSQLTEKARERWKVVPFEEDENSEAFRRFEKTIKTSTTVDERIQALETAKDEPEVSDGEWEQLKAIVDELNKPTAAN